MIYLYLLDTNIMSELIKNPRGVIFSQIQQIGEDKLTCASIPEMILHLPPHWVSPNTALIRT
jgi:predicted nucleic acid-binding protein